MRARCLLFLESPRGYLLQVFATICVGDLNGSASSFHHRAATPAATTVASGVRNNYSQFASDYSLLKLSHQQIPQIAYISPSHWSRCRAQVSRLPFNYREKRGRDEKANFGRF